MQLTSSTQIATDDFVRRFSLRAPNLMWLLGAGTSASAGIPTAIDMLWEFKQNLYTSQRQVSRQSVADLSNPQTRARLQAYIDSSDRLPPEGDSGEYAALFEEVYPSETDRRIFLDAKITGAKPSYGQLALATLVYAGKTRLIWTTNFDTLVADACAKVFDTTGVLTTVNLDAPTLAAQAIDEQRWPIEVKLHGDFRSRRLKNTPEELRQQDGHLRKILINSCQRFGLVVAGYSGRDNSVMDTLEEAVTNSGTFPAGLFWLHRGDEPPLPRVVQLLDLAATNNIEALLVSVENFDEILRDLIHHIDNIDTSTLDSFSKERQHWSPAPRFIGQGNWPVVRLNALKVNESPSVCRRVVCDIGGAAEVRKAVEQANVDIIATRSQAGVLAFGTDSDIRTTFDPYHIVNFDLHTLEIKRRRYESTERGLLRTALTRALVRQCDLDAIRRRNTDLLVPTNPNENSWQPLRNLVGTLSGNVPDQQDLVWREGVSIRLDWANDCLWVLFEPSTVFDNINDDNKIAAAIFARERMVRRYNRKLNDLIDFWAKYLAQGEQKLRAFGIGDGIDATFRLLAITSFSRRART